MTSEGKIDSQTAHERFSAGCFNQVWELLDKPDRSVDEDESMLHACHASLWHWLQRRDCSRRNLSVGYWQLARVNAVLKRAAEATRYAEHCLEHSREESPFFLGYAYEALARASLATGTPEKTKEFLQLAMEQAALIDDAAEKSMLMADLRAIDAALLEHVTPN